VAVWIASLRSQWRGWDRAPTLDGSAVARPFIFPRLQIVSRPPHRFHFPGPIRPL